MPAKKKSKGRRRAPKKKRRSRKKPPIPLALVGGGILSAALVMGAPGGAPNNFIAFSKIGEKGSIGGEAFGNIQWAGKNFVAVLLPVIGGALISKGATIVGINRQVSKLTKGKAKI